MSKLQRYKELASKHSGNCARCHSGIEAGQQIVWDSTDRKAYCAACTAECSAGGLLVFTAAHGGGASVLPGQRGLFDAGE